MEIERNSSFFFSYNSRQINASRKVSVNLENKVVMEALDEIFYGEGVKYTIDDKHIILYKTTRPESSRIILQDGGRTVSGIVSDPAGEALPGVHISVKGTVTGTISDADGRYTIHTPGENAVLVFSSIGYSTREMIVGNRTILDIILNENMLQLEEVIVVGYGVQKRNDVTGAVIRIGEKDLTSRPVNNMLEGMQGKAAGVDIASSERPGTLGSITIRGVRSLTASNSPLYVVDGIPLMTGGIDYLNPNDIEAIDILKDASATAIYGSRGANGVVIVTTKQGKSGKVTLNYSGSMTMESLEDLTVMMNAAEYIDFRRWAYYYSSPSTFPRGDQPTQDNDFRIFLGGSAPHSWANIMKGWASGTWDGSKVESTDWTGIVTQTGITNEHTVSASGGTEQMKGYISFGYLDNKGTLRGQGYTRYTGKATFDVTPAPWFSMGGNINAGYSIQEYGQSNIGSNSPLYMPSNFSIYLAARENPAYTVPFDDEGNRLLYPGGDDAIKTVVDEWKYSQDQRTTYRTFGSFFMQLDFGKMLRSLDGLKFRMNFGPDFSLYRDGIFLDGLSVLRNGSSYASLAKNQTISYTLDNLLYYDRKIGKHTFGATLLQSQTRYNYESSSMNANGIPLSSQKWNALTTTDIPTLNSWSSGMSQRQLMSYMARLNYNLSERYLLTLSGRWDGASQLAEGHKWSFFPSTALAWRLDQEDFWSDNDRKWIERLKIRAGIGVTGNAAINPYVTKGSIWSLFYPFGPNLTPGTNTSSTLANQGLGWERTTQYNLGIDFSFLRGRISGIIDLYTSHTKDLLMQMSIPSITGYTTTYANIGETAGRGIDITLNTINLSTRDLQWTTDINLSCQKDHIVSLANGKEDDVNNRWFIGQPQNVLYDYQSGGIWQESDAEEMAKFNANGHTFQAGTIRPVDQNGDYRIDANNDRVIVGHYRPQWIAGMNNTFSYKGLELSVFLHGRMDYTVDTQGEMQTGRYNQRKISYYTENNPHSDYQKPVYSAGGTGDIYYKVLGYKDGSFIKIRNISLGYHFPRKWVGTLGITNLKLYFQARNPGLLYSKIDWWDPDLLGSIRNSGCTFGMNIEF
jgi:TonB-linked SusC/RagA family outer membrane protein